VYKARDLVTGKIVALKCWVLGSLPMWRKGPKFEKPMSHLNLVERRL